MLTDPIADYLTRIRNALGSGHDEVEIPASRLKMEMSRILKEQGYILDFAQAAGRGRRGDQDPAQVHRGPPPGDRSAWSGSRAPAAAATSTTSRSRASIGGTGTAIVSTSVGVMTGHEAKAKGVGGEVVAYVW